jgi:hypothetical protein
MMYVSLRNSSTVGIPSATRARVDSGRRRVGIDRPPRLVCEDDNGKIVAEYRYEDVSGYRLSEAGNDRALLC